MERRKGLEERLPYASFQVRYLTTLGDNKNRHPAKEDCRNSSILK
jgi:hypothetical protein